MAKSYLDHDGLAYFWDLIKAKLNLKLNASDAVTGVKGESESSYRKGDVNITKANIDLDNVTNDRQVVGNASGTTGGHIVTWGSDGYHVQDSGKSISNFLDSNAFKRMYIPLLETVAVTQEQEQPLVECESIIPSYIADYGGDIVMPSFLEGSMFILHLNHNPGIDTDAGTFLLGRVTYKNSAGQTISWAQELTYCYVDDQPLHDQYEVGSYLLMTRKYVNNHNCAYVLADLSKRYGIATQTTDGLMSSADKQKLDGVSTIPYVATTNMAAGAALTGVCPELTELTEGQSIILHLSYPAGTNATLNLTLADGTTTGAKNLYYGGTTRLSTHYAPGNDIRLTYHEGISIAGSGLYTGWWAEGNRDTTYSNATTSKAGLMTAADKVKLDKFSDADNYALKTDISTMYKYKGSLDDMAALQAVSAKEVGDVYNIETDGANYAWNGTEWDSLGGIFEITNITQAQIDAIVAS